MDDARRTTHDGHPVTLKAPLEHVVLRWAKNKCLTFNNFLQFVKMIMNLSIVMNSIHTENNFGLDLAKSV